MGGRNIQTPILYFSPFLPNLSDMFTCDWDWRRRIRWERPRLLPKAMGVVATASGAAGTTSEDVQSVNANCRASSARGRCMRLQRIWDGFHSGQNAVRRQGDSMTVCLSDSLRTGDDRKMELSDQWSSSFCNGVAGKNVWCWSMMNLCDVQTTVRPV